MEVPLVETPSLWGGGLEMLVTCQKANIVPSETNRLHALSVVSISLRLSLSSRRGIPSTGLVRRALGKGRSCPPGVVVGERRGEL